MLESAIKKLCDAVEANTKALERIAVSNVGSPTEDQCTLPDKPQKEEVQTVEIVSEEQEKANTELTADDLKALAKDAMASGTSRADIKVMISELGAENLSGLDQQSLVVLSDKLKGLAK